MANSEQETFAEPLPKEPLKTGAHGQQADTGIEQNAKMPPLPRRLWNKTGLNVGMLCLMTKGALPPLIATAIYQATPVAQVYSTSGYLVAIMSILSLAILPRSKHLQSLLLNTVGVCIGAGVALLTIYCSVQARIHTSPTSLPLAGPTPAAATAPYNSSASAVSAVWLFFNILIANAFRASRPQLQLPVIIYSIFANVAGTYSPLFPTMAAGISFVKSLLEAFLTGFAIAFGVNLFVFPISSRDVVFKDASAYIKALQGTLKALTGYLQTLEDKDMFSPNIDPEIEEPSKVVLGAQKLKAALGGLSTIHGKMHGDLSFAKKEIAFGKLDAKDISTLFKLLRGAMLPQLGIGSVGDIFNRLAEKRGWNKESDNLEGEATGDGDQERKSKEVREWNEILKSVHDPFEALSDTLHEGLQHVLFALELEKKPKQNPPAPKGKDSAAAIDLEAQGEIVRPGEKGFAASFASNVARYRSSREVALRTWCNQRGIDLREDAFNGTAEPSAPIELDSSNPFQHERAQQQLYLLLFMHYLLYATGQAILDIIQFADSKVEAGVMKKRRLILPGKRRARKWITNVFKHEDTAVDHTPDSSEVGLANIYVGDSLQAKQKDAEHLPPTNAWQRFGNGIRDISHLLSSPEVAFGFRVACATMSIAIIAFLRSSQAFFNEQRLVWAMIMVAIGMTPTAGSGVFGFVLRVLGTFVAMCMSFVIWYIAGGRGATVGVLILLFVALFVEFSVLLKYPRWTPGVLITMVTQVLILGYELEVRKIGIVTASSTGQPYYPIYELAPYRLATVAGGCFIGFLWLYFPYPITARSQLRKDLGASLFLLANYYACVKTTVRMRLRGAEGDSDDKNSNAQKLEKAREKIFSKQLVIIAGLRVHSSYTAFEFTLGGKFPRKQYDLIINQTQSILYYIALISYATREYSHNANDPTGHKWIKDLNRILDSVDATSQEITSVLTILSASVTSGSPLPPYLKAPTPYQLSTKLEALDADILSVNHVTEAGYANFAVTQVASSLISDDLAKLIENIRGLVGEVNFTFHPIAKGSSETLLGEGGHKGKKD